LGNAPSLLDAGVVRPLPNATAAHEESALRAPARGLYSPHQAKQQRVLPRDYRRREHRTASNAIAGA
jgi:hypothetical protein